jgi:hypothetical protein
LALFGGEVAAVADDGEGDVYAGDGEERGTVVESVGELGGIGGVEVVLAGLERVT